MTTHIYYPTLENGPITWNWMPLTGPDAKDFLHRLTTVNLRQMDAGDGAPGCFLTAQGKIRSFFYLWNPVKDQYAFEFDAGRSGKWKTDLLSIIDQYTFGEKIQLEDLTPPLKCAWIFPEESQLSRLGLAFPKKPANEAVPELGQMIQTSLEDGSEPDIKICNHGTANYGRNWLTVWAMPEILDKWISKNFATSIPLKFEELENWRIQAVRPRMDSEITESAVPLEIGLRTAIADNKGCYPGQEVIEKIVALGSPAKRLVRIEGVGKPPQVGDRVQAIDATTHQAGAEIGTITTTPSHQDPNAKFAVLALLRKTHAKEGTHVGFLNHPQVRGTVVKIAPHA
ncbi:MAG: hypothetical protein ABIQ95_04515 [Bdellovibrionia bacterium]